MKIVVIGPGAIGCLLAALLSEDHRVLLLDHNSERAELIRRQGVILEEGGAMSRHHPGILADPGRIAGRVELILLCVKAGAAGEALAAVRRIAARDTLLIAFQNGIAHLPLLAGAAGSFAGALGVTSHGATLAGPGHVLHKGKGLTRIGLFPQPSASADRAGERLIGAAEALTGAGIETEPVDDILNHVWRKLLINAGINALTAIHGCANGALLERADTIEVMRAAILEGREVAEKSGIELGGDPVEAAIGVCRATAANLSSMLQDVRAKRATEVEAINGALLRRGAELGVAMPVNAALVRKIRALEAGYGVFS